jgi:hypothetical protein
MPELIENRLLLKTAFVCIACDGNIDKKEVEIVHKISMEEGLFSDNDLQKELDDFVDSFNDNCDKFIADYFQELKVMNLTPEIQLLIIKNAISAIRADESIDYHEVKFFKAIRKVLSISDDAILAVYPDIEDFLEQDIVYVSFEDQIKSLFFASEQKVKYTKIDITSNPVGNE